jgi:hypothetical protein
MSRENDVLLRINDSIARLFRLSRQMRQHITARLDEKADLFEPKEERDKIREQEYRTHLKWKLEYHPHWKISDDFIKERLRATMLLRGRRLLFYSRNSLREEVLTHVPKLFETSVLPTPTTKTAVSSEDVSHLPLTRGMQDPQTAVATQTESMHSTGFSSFKPHADRGSVVTSRKTKSLIGVKKHDFPKAPAVSSELSGFMCPLCRRRQPVAEHEPKFWQ